jgi:2-oxoisovalerate dehydrogenase E1 component alpha subunit
MTTVASFQIEYTQFLDADGIPAQFLPEFAKDPKALSAFYRAMVLTRAFDAKAVALQRTGKLGTFASSVGQEAIGVGLASAMRAEDALFPSYRDHAAQLLRGVTMAESLLYWGGDSAAATFPRHRTIFRIACRSEPRFPTRPAPPMRSVCVASRVSPWRSSATAARRRAMFTKR